MRYMGKCLIINESQCRMMAELENKRVSPGNALIITDKQARSIQINECIDSILEHKAGVQYKLHGVPSDEWFAQWDSWFDEHRGADGKIDDNMIGQECLDLLKKAPHMTFDDKHQFIHLPNNCKFFLRKDFRESGDLDLYELWLPTGDALDGECFDPELDEAIQKELVNHIIWR